MDLNKLRAKQGLPPQPPKAEKQGKPAEKVPEKEPENQPSSKPKAEKPAKPKQPTLRYLCGHERPPILCGECRNKLSREQAARRAEKKGDKNFARQSKQDVLKGRLPEGATYHKTYDAGKTEWTCTLTIPGLPTFEARASGSFKAETTCDDLYRAYLREQGVKS